MGTLAELQVGTKKKRKKKGLVANQAKRLIVQQALNHRVLLETGFFSRASPVS